MTRLRTGLAGGLAAATLGAGSVLLAPSAQAAPSSSAPASESDTGETSCAWRDPDGIQARYGVLWSTESVAPAFAETIRSAAAPGAVHDAYRAEVVQQADEGAHRPLVVIATPSDPKTQPSLAITYPGSDVTICAPNVDTVEQARALATDLGFVGG